MRKFFSTLFDKALDNYRMPNKCEVEVFIPVALRLIKCIRSFTEASKLYVDCQRQQQPADHLLLAWGAIFGSKPGKKPQIRNFSCSWIIRPPTLLPQPGLSCYSEASARKCADESFRAINSINGSVSFKRQYSPAPLIGSIPNSIVRKGRILGADIEFVVQLLVHRR